MAGAQGGLIYPFSPFWTPGSQADGSTLLPNGWRLSPAGRHLPVGDLPLNLVQAPDSRYLIVTNNGLSKPSLVVVDLANWTIKSTLPLDNAWLGLVWSADGTKLYSSGANQNAVREFNFADGILTPARTFVLPAVSDGDTFAGGLAVSRDGRRLYVTRVFAQTLSVIDLASGQVRNTISLPAEPYTCVVSNDDRQVFVSLWGGSRVQVYAASNLMLLDELPTDEHPTALLYSPDGRLFVAAASASAVWVFDGASREVNETISTSLFPAQPPTSTPNSLAISPDGRTLLVANADTNTAAVIDVSNAAQSFVEGFIPTGWYPTGAIFSRDGKQVFILSGKGLKSAANPAGGLTLAQGTVSVVSTPDRTTLAGYTRTARALSRYSDAKLVAPIDAPVGSPIPRVVGASSPIKHVFYIIRENRTYDQVLGDESAGNGDPSLAIFGRSVTPNAHALAETNVLFDNFYVDADVSYNGHAYSTAAYSTDFIEKIWRTTYGHRGAPYLSEGDGLMRNPFGNISAPMQGYIWDYARLARVSVRSYGEFVRTQSKSPSGDVVSVESVPGLHGAVAPAYAGFDLGITDNRRADVWLGEFADYVSTGNLPKLSIIRLGNDHTAGAAAGFPTPRAMVADNDLALGRIVEAIAGSVYWKESAIFVLEDDAQNGPDHVDSHRSVLLVAGPFARRMAADHTFYSTASVLRTIELILGLPPMSHYDASATPLYNAFQATPDLSRYRRQMPGVSLDEKNVTSSYGSIASAAMDLTDADRAPEAALNDIIWRSVRGAGSPVPPPRRSGFVRPSSRTSADDEDDR